jgi:hypothetical protein
LRRFLFLSQHTKATEELRSQMTGVTNTIKQQMEQYRSRLVDQVVRRWRHITVRGPAQHLCACGV